MERPFGVRVTEDCRRIGDLRAENGGATNAVCTYTNYDDQFGYPTGAAENRVLGMGAGGELDREIDAWRATSFRDRLESPRVLGVPERIERTSVILRSGVAATGETTATDYDIDARGDVETETVRQTVESGAAAVVSRTFKIAADGRITDVQAKGDSSAPWPAEATAPAAISSPGEQTRNVHVDYDAEGLFPLTTTNTLGHKVTTFYHPSFGQVVARVDENGHISSFRYDGFGRAKATTEPGIGAVEISYRRSQTGTIAVTTKRYGVGDTITVTDKLGRPTLSSCHSPGSWGHVSPGSWDQVTGIKDLRILMPQIGRRCEPGGPIGADVRRRLTARGAQV